MVIVRPNERHHVHPIRPIFLPLLSVIEKIWVLATNLSLGAIHCTENVAVSLVAKIFSSSENSDLRRVYWYYNA